MYYHTACSLYLEDLRHIYWGAHLGIQNMQTQIFNQNGINPSHAVISMCTYMYMHMFVYVHVRVYVLY